MKKYSYLARCIVFFAVLLAGEFTLSQIQQTADPLVATNAALASVNGNDQTMMEQRAYETTRRHLRLITTLGYMALAVALFARPWKDMLRKPVSTISPRSP